MNIALGSDHRGTALIQVLTHRLEAGGHHVIPVGVCTEDSCDYPENAFAVADAVRSGHADRGVVICGSGIGVSIAANKVDGVRAALAFDATAAKMSRLHNDANVVCIAADRTEQSEAEAIVDVFVATDFEGGRHARRVEKITAIERGADPAAVTTEAR